MSDLNEYRSRINIILHKIFGLKEWFEVWLDLKTESGFAPAGESALGREILHELKVEIIRGNGEQVPGRPSDLLAWLKSEGVDWGQAIRQSFEKAESEWPTVAESHRVLLDRIKKVWK